MRFTVHLSGCLSLLVLFGFLPRRLRWVAGGLPMFVSASDVAKVHVDTLVAAECERGRLSENQRVCGTRRHAADTVQASDTRGSGPESREVIPAETAHC